MTAATAVTTMCATCGEAFGQWVSPTLERIGLFGIPEFTSPDGLEVSQPATGSFGSGYVAGSSTRYAGGGGLASWVWRPGIGSERIGLHGTSEFERNDGYQSSTYSDSSTYELAVTGFSNRYNGGGQQLGRASWIWTPTFGTVKTGLYSAEYTRADGYQNSYGGGHANGSSIISGTSARFSGSTDLGQAVWRWDPGNGTQRVGFFDTPEFTRSNGYQYSELRGMSSEGWVTGYSDRFNGTTFNKGRTVWVWNPTDGAQRMGLVAAPEFHTSSGTEHSDLSERNLSREFAGVSFRYNAAGSQRGQGTWRWDPDAGTIRTGLFSSPEFMRADGYQYSKHLVVNPLTDAGQACGSSERFNGGSTLLGEATWVASRTGVSTRTGLYAGPEFTRADGYQLSLNDQQHENGTIGGNSERFNGGTTSAGWSAWIWDSSAGTRRVGLEGGAEFTRADGYQDCRLDRIRDDGRVVGHSARFNGGSQDMGRASWMWTAEGGAVRTGFFQSPEFTRADGYEDSYAPQGTYGRSARFSGSTSLGLAAWAWAPVTGSVRIGLWDDFHTSSTGYQDSIVERAHASGLLVGRSDRFGGGASQLGHSGWAVDPENLSTIPLVFSVADDGRAETRFTSITDSGWVLGNYDLYDGNSLLAARAFIWCLDYGFADLGDVVEGGLEGAGWSNLLFSRGIQDTDMLTGYGRILAHPDGLGAFVIRSVPSPTSASLICVGAVMLGRRRGGRRG